MSFGGPFGGGGYINPQGAYGPWAGCVVWCGAGTELTSRG